MRERRKLRILFAVVIALVVVMMVGTLVIYNNNSTGLANGHGRGAQNPHWVVGMAVVVCVCAGLALFGLLLGQHIRFERHLGDSKAQLHRTIEARRQDRLKQFDEIQYATRRWDAAFNSMTELLFITDTGGKILEANKGMEQAFPNEAVVGKHCYEILRGRGSRCLSCPVEGLLMDHCPRIHQVTGPQVGNRILSVEASPLVDDAGHVTHVVYVVRDVTEERRAQEALRKSEEKFVGLFHHSNDGIIVHDLDWTILDVNPRGAELLELPREEIIGASTAQWIPPEEMGMAEFAMERIRTDGFCRFEMRVQRGSGDYFNAEISAGLIDINGAQSVQCVVRDVTERRMADVAFRRLRKENEMILNCAGEGIFGVDARGFITFINSAASTMIGREPEDVIGMRHHDLAQHSNVDGEAQPWEDGVICRAIREGREFVERGEWFWHKDGCCFPVAYICSPLMDGGEIVGAVVVYRDVAEEKRAAAEEHAHTVELERLNLELARSNRDLEDFTYAVSHDLQEPLRKMHAFAGFLAEDAGDGLSPDCLDHLGRIQSGADRMKMLIQHILDLSRVGRNRQFDVVDSSAVLRKVFDTFSHRVSECGAQLSVEGEMPEVWADAVQLERVFQNLIGNALKFVPNDRSPVVRITASVKDGMAAFRVSDNGIGIKREYCEKIFGVFTRLNKQEEFDGSGVGLALCAKVVSLHGGDIRVESVPDSGSVFMFTIPLADDFARESFHDSELASQEEPSFEGATV
jgi:PAS domain S-box-containing protein